MSRQTIREYTSEQVPDPERQRSGPGRELGAARPVRRTRQGRQDRAGPHDLHLPGPVIDLLTTQNAAPSGAAFF